MADAQWYVVHTYSGYENNVKINLEKTIENRKLQDVILDVRVPMQDTLELKNGTRVLKKKMMFPGYVLVHMVMNDNTWYVVRNTRGVTGFVGPGSKPVPLTEREIENMGLLSDGTEAIPELSRVRRLSFRVVTGETPPARSRRSTTASARLWLR